MDLHEFFDFTNVLTKLGIIPVHIRDAVDSVYNFPDSDLAKHLRRLNRKGILSDILLYDIRSETT